MQMNPTTRAEDQGLAIQRPGALRRRAPLHIVP